MSKITNEEVLESTIEILNRIILKQNKASEELSKKLEIAVILLRRLVESEGAVKPEGKPLYSLNPSFQLMKCASAFERTSGELYQEVREKLERNGFI